MFRPAWVNWALLPGTVVSEMAYIFGCLITGGEIRRAKLISVGGVGRSRSRQGQDAPATDSSPRLKIVGPIVASLIAIVAPMAGIVLIEWLSGGEVIRTFVGGGRGPVVLVKWPAALAQTIPLSWDGFWKQLGTQVSLLRRMCETWVQLDWLDWRTGVFIYLTACLSVRLAPMRRPVRPALAAVAAIAAVIALVGAVSSDFKGLMQNIWPLLTYVWTMLLFGLVATGLVRGALAFVRVLTERDTPPRAR